MNQTICAIATGSHNSGVGIIRISGDKCREIGDKILQKSLKPRYAHYGDFFDDGQIIDQGIALFFPAPNSFTGEDVLELQGHGGSIVLQNILQTAVKNGAKLADAGEFSKRAFLNGKIDLIQAEAIADMIDANSQKSAKLALNSLTGEFSKLINTLTTEIIELRVFVEATIDFVDEEIDFIADNKVLQKLENIKQRLEQILATSKQGAIIKNGINIAIIGKPNAGKSSLLNALTLEESAIVTDIAGTTRDIIKEQININGLSVNLIDTAGIRKSLDKVEAIGIKKAQNAGKQADIVLLVFEEDKPDLSLIKGIDNYILVQNKVDKKVQKFPDALHISAKKNLGIKELKQQILTRAGVSDLSENAILARSRHIIELQSALQFIELATLELSGANIELVAVNLTSAGNHLGKITGEFSTDDLLGEIFSSFCIGK